MRLRKKGWIAAAIEEYRDEYILLDGAAELRGHWRELFGGRPVALEIGCGKGDFLTGMAAANPGIGYVGIETALEVAYYPAKKAKVAELTNVRVIRGDAALLEEWFAPEEADIIYLNFSDPWPKARHAKRRLTHRTFLQKYERILRAGGHLRFKTDNDDLFAFSVEEFKAYGLEITALTNDLHNSACDNPVWTEYETKFSKRGKNINFCEVVFTCKKDS